MVRSRSSRCFGALALAVLIALGLGCSGNNYSRSDTPLFLVVTVDREGDNGGTANTITEVSNVDDLCSDITDIQIEAREIGGPHPTSPFLTVDLDMILIWYENIDTAVDEVGTTVPAPSSYVVASELPSGGTTSIMNVPFVPATAKMESPLNNATGLGYPIRLIVHIVVQGHMITNPSERVTGELTMQVNVWSAGPTVTDPDHCR